MFLTEIAQVLTSSVGLGTVEHWADEVASEAGFTDVGHTVELFGLCPKCSKS